MVSQKWVLTKSRPAKVGHQKNVHTWKRRHPSDSINCKGCANPSWLYGKSRSSARVEVVEHSGCFAPLRSARITIGKASALRMSSLWVCSLTKSIKIHQRELKFHPRGLHHGRKGPWYLECMGRKAQSNSLQPALQTTEQHWGTQTQLLISKFSKARIRTGQLNTSIRNRQPWINSILLG